MPLFSNTLPISHTSAAMREFEHMARIFHCRPTRVVTRTITVLSTGGLVHAAGAWNTCWIGIMSWTPPWLAPSSTVWFR